MRGIASLLLIPLLAALAGAAWAEPGGGGAHVRAGKTVALQVCAYCHVVAPDQDTPPTLRQSTPSFTDIANGHDTTAAGLRRFLATTHWDGRTLPMTMPNPLLMDEDVNNVVDYILSLRAGAPAPVRRLTARERQVDAGEFLALQLCSYCHQVSSDQRYRPELSPAAPAFAAIAARPDVSAKSLGHFIRSTHWDEKTFPITMPNPSLSDAQTEEVAAYILSQRPRR